MGYEQIKVERRRAVVGYCDVSGFMSWVERSEIAHRVVIPFIQKMKWNFLKFQEETGYFSIPTGDGIIAILDYPINDTPVNVLGLINTLSGLAKELTDLADEQQSPRPGQSRIRITEGVVYRTEEPLFAGRARAVDFIGEPLNLGSRLLGVRRELPNLITEGAMEVMSHEDKAKFIFEPVEIEGRLPRGVKMEEMAGLCTFSPNSGMRFE